jgi:nucleoid-associated protein YgaU
MGFFDFVKEAGAKLVGGGGPSAAERAAALQNHVVAMKLGVEGLVVDVEGDVAIVKGKVPTQEAREKVVLSVGNSAGIARVDDRLEVVAQKAVEPEKPAVFYTVKSGDTLSKIAKQQYGDPMKYPAIFEANKPMLTHPDKIYPGQVLRIPPQQ